MTPPPASRHASLIHLVAALAIGFVLAAGVGAAAPQLDDKEPISLALKDADLRETLVSFATITGAHPEIDPDVEGSVTIDIQSVPWGEILRRICVDHDLSCEMLGQEPPILRVRTLAADKVATDGDHLPGYFDPISLSLKAADLRMVLQVLEGISGWTVVLDEAVTGEVTIDVAAVPWPRLLAEVCRVHGCRTRWSDDGIAITAAEPTTFDLDLQDADPRSALERIVDRRIFGQDGLTVETTGGGSEPVTLQLAGVTWPEALTAFCDLRRCSWTVRYGDPSVLVVTYPDPRLEIAVAPKRRSTLAEAATVLADTSGLNLFLGPLLDPDQEVTFDAKADLSLKAALEALCADGRCHWQVRGDELRIVARGGTLSQFPSGKIEPDPIRARLLPPEGDAIEAPASFTWSRSSLTLGQGAWWAQVAWVPFAADRHLVVPAVIRCDGDEAKVEWLEPATLPLHKARSWAHDGGILQIVSTGDGPAAQDRAGVAPCLREKGRIVATIRRAGTRGDETVIRSEVGTCLLVSPPAGESRQVTAAVVALGAHPDGRQILVLVTSTDDGIQLEPFTLAPEHPFERRIRSADGRDFDLRVQVDR